MNQIEKRKYLIEKLLKEQSFDKEIEIPDKEEEQKKLLRILFNLRMPKAIDKEFLCIQDKYLQEEIFQKGITNLNDLTAIMPNIYLWQGDITTLKCDAIVNAANPEMLGCFYPNHGCIDNAIHTFAGVQLRLECFNIMRQQGQREKIGQAKITASYNLPCKYILHTVGPIVRGELTQQHERELANCYISCLELASKYALKSIAFCCISTGEYRFPNEKAGEIAIKTVKEYIQANKTNLKVVFNVFKDYDKEIYTKLLREN